ncbi:MAG TPA: TIGR04282 family arsenosugar biosynthesis glycosyltransferase [Alphaproteobacteria bacterium]|nr:TIGR04282 family arsenosugar biosynthesis glycosyltransferase [Alphaproteobacteria bacterium]
MIRRILVVFAKAPALGRVKSRLARGIGSAAALAFYRRTLARLLKCVAKDRRWETVLVVSPDAASRKPALWPTRAQCLPQGGGDLGMRMGRVFRRLPKGYVVIIGADIPDIRADHVARAFAALGTSDFVFGPARDGGYWLIGAKGAARNAAMFANVRWSTAHALADTVANLGAWKMAELDMLDDIDDAPAYRRYLRRSAAG